MPLLVELTDQYVAGEVCFASVLSRQPCSASDAVTLTSPWSFTPAMSDKAMKAKGKQIRDWHLNRRSGTDLSGLAEEINPQVRGWINYYGAFYRSRLHRIALRIDQHLVRWAMQKFKRLRGRVERAWAWLTAVRQRQPQLFAHWSLISRAARGRPVGAR